MSLAPPSRPNPLIGAFALLMFLPVLLAIIDIWIGRQLPYTTRLVVWNLPWLIIAGAVVLLAWMDARRAKMKFWAIRPVDLGIIIFIGLFSLVSSRILAANPSASDLHLLRLGVSILIGISAYYGMLIYQEKFSGVVYYMLIAGAIMLVPLVLYVIYFQQEYRTLGDSLSWVVPAFGAVRLFGIYYEVVIALCLGLLVTTENRPVKLLLSIVLVILWAALLWSGGRGALVSLVISVGLTSLFYRKRALKLWLVFLATGAAGAWLSLLVWVPEHASFGILRMLESAQGEDANAFSAGRLERWIDVIDLIKDRPFFGYGLGQFSNVWYKYAVFDGPDGGFGTGSLYFLAYRNAHNIVLEAIFAWGAVAVLFFGLLAKAWMKMAKLAAHTALIRKLPAFLALNALLFHSNFAGVYVFPHSLIYMAIFFGICLAPNPAQNEYTNR